MASDEIRIPEDTERPMREPSVPLQEGVNFLVSFHLGQPISFELPLRHKIDFELGVEAAIRITCVQTGIDNQL